MTRKMMMALVGVLGLTGFASTASAHESDLRRGPAPVAVRGERAGFDGRFDGRRQEMARREEMLRRQEMARREEMLRRQEMARREEMLRHQREVVRRDRFGRRIAAPAPVIVHRGAPLPRGR